jgi:hypothetical protein
LQGISQEVTERFYNLLVVGEGDRCLKWVKTSNAQNEQVFSGLSSIADIQPQQFPNVISAPFASFWRTPPSRPRVGKFKYPTTYVTSGGQVAAVFVQV